MLLEESAFSNLIDTICSDQRVYTYNIGLFENSGSMI